MRAILVAAFLLPLAAAPSAWAQGAAVDGERLPALLAARGFEPPPGFKALVVRIDADGATTSFDWRGTSDDREGWWPASSVKIYAAVAAMEAMGVLGFPMRTLVTFHYERDGEPAPVTRRFDQIVRHAIARSSNPDFDMLIELVGFDELNRGFFVARNGFRRTVFLRGYSGRERDPVTGVDSARPSPRIGLRHGRRTRELPARLGTGEYPCPNEGNCTTLAELAEVMRRIMLHDELPESERYRLEPTGLGVLRDAMAIARNRRLAEIVEETFGEIPVRVWHKPGFALRWVSDVLFVQRQDTGERWILAMAAQPDRRALDDAAARLAALLRDGALRATDPAR